MQAVVMVCSVSVHPRWRGEHNNAELHFLGTNGSSPLARGTPEDARSDAEFGRFIPAGAGNTSSPPWAMRSKTVHPRWRGEHVEDAMADLAIVGSSPLARGTRYRGVVVVEGERFIPAGAGNTFR